MSFNLRDVYLNSPTHRHSRILTGCWFARCCLLLSCTNPQRMTVNLKMAPNASEIRRILQVYDQSSLVSSRQAVGMLEGITSQLAKSPADYDLKADPADAEAWEEAGGSSYCENQEFPGLLAARWLEVLNKPDFGNAGFDKDELEDLKDDMEDWIEALEKHGLEFGDTEQLLGRLDELIEAAPEAEDSDEDSD